MGQTHGCSLHPSSRAVGLCASMCDGDIYFLVFYLVLISVLEHIRYMMTYSPNVSNMSVVISFFGDIVDNCCT